LQAVEALLCFGVLFRNRRHVWLALRVCASAYHWSPELKALGDTVRLMPPAYLF
jgi:transposase